MRLKPASCLVLVRQLKQTVKAKADEKAKADGKSKENEIKEIPGIQVCACFTVGFTLPLVLLYRWFYFTVGFNQRTGSKTIKGFSPID